MLSSEAVPFVKTGGLADVVGALSSELTRMGQDVRLALPRYASFNVSSPRSRRPTTVSVPTPEGLVQAKLEEGEPETGAASVLALRYDPFFDRSGYYGEGGRDYPDNLRRFAFFCRAVMEACAQAGPSGWKPDILHAHDWQAALAVVYLKTLYQAHPVWSKARALFTIHNMGYQGIFPVTDFPWTGLPWSEFTHERLEFYGQVNLLKGGLVYADVLNTVSPTYAREIQTAEFGNGLEGVLQLRSDRLVGITNGIDYDAWNPATDPYLPAHFTVDDLSGKKACKVTLQGEMGLPPRDVPVVGFVSRLAFQKGIDLIVEVLPKLLALDVQMVVLGSGEPSYHRLLTALAERFSDRLAVRLAFDEGLAHRIEAGADIFLMPSRYEPCGLNQMYSLRYGTVPVVRETGGLADTVVPYLPEASAMALATGFAFDNPHPEVLLSTLLLALRVYRDKEEWQSLIRSGMQQDNSWRNSAKQYVGLYELAMEVPQVTLPA